MRDVAQRAGVSLATVSHVLNKTRHTAPDTVQRVMDAVRDLKYYPNAHARRLAMHRSDLFGLLISEVSNPFFSEIIKGFQTAAWENGFDTLLFNTEHDTHRTQRALRQMLESGVRGVAVMSSALQPAAMEELRAAGIALVFYNLGPARKLVSNIRIDYKRGIEHAVQHLIDLGHTRAAVISGPRSNRTAAAVQEAIVDALVARNIDPAPIVESKYQVDGGASAVCAILDQADVPTAILCGNDLIAMGAMSALEEAGVRVPDDVSIIGFDDIFFARLTRPPLTTVNIPREQLGKIAFKALFKMVNSKRQIGAEYDIETELIVRKSTSVPRSRRIRKAVESIASQFLPEKRLNTD